MNKKSKKSKSDSKGKPRQFKKVQAMKRKKSKMAKKRRTVEHKKLVATQQLKDLKFKVQIGDSQARDDIARKIKELKENSDTNKKARKDMYRYKKILLVNRNRKD